MKNTLIQIFGDSTIEWQIVKPAINSGFFIRTEKKFPSVLHSQAGSAGLTTEFLKCLLKDFDTEITGISIQHNQQSADSKEDIATTWDNWQAYSDKTPGNPAVYRIRERIADKLESWSQPIGNINKTPDLIVIEECSYS
jgi:hypothetical protein